MAPHTFSHLMAISLEDSLPGWQKSVVLIHASKVMALVGKSYGNGYNGGGPTRRRPTLKSFLTMTVSWKTRA